MSDISQIDLSTALEISFNDPLAEAKFNALKVLQEKKIKSLMGSIDNLQKEIGKLKAQSKDHLRTQIIQALKKKVKDFEFTIDVLKEELAKYSKKSPEEINSFVIAETISGPKRFRPLTREELENQIAELERRLKRANASGTKLTAESKSTVLPSQSVPATVGSKGVGNIKAEKKHFAADSSAGDNRQDLVKLAQLSEDLEKVTLAATVKEETIHSLKTELLRLRARNNELRVYEEKIHTVDAKYNELELSYKVLSEEIDEVTQKLIESQSECDSLKRESDFDAEQQRIEIETLHQQCERLLKQNTSLLKKLSDIERTLMEKTRGKGGSGGGGGGVNTIVDKMDTSMTGHTSNQTLELKIDRLQEKVKAYEEKITSLNTDLAQVNTLRDNLREKNETIRDLKRTLAEVQRLHGRGNLGAKEEGAKASGSGVSGADKDVIIKELQEENRRLRENVASAAAPKQQGKNTSLNRSEVKSGNGVSNSLLQSVDSMAEYQLKVLEKLLSLGYAVNPPLGIRQLLESVLKEYDGLNNEVLSRLIMVLGSVSLHLDDLDVDAGSPLDMSLSPDKFP